MPPYAPFVLFIHHIFNNFLHFGWLTKGILLKIYIITVPLVALHWRLNHNRCWLTEQHNKMCGRPLGEPFHDFLLPFKRYPLWNNYLHYLTILLFMFIAFTKDLFG
jgi:hypothetical protein